MSSRADSHYVALLNAGHKRHLGHLKKRVRCRFFGKKHALLSDASDFTQMQSP